VSSLT